MVTCSYSGKEMKPGTGIMYVQKDGKILYFADSKCEKNFLMGRISRKQKWVTKNKL